MITKNDCLLLLADIEEDCSDKDILKEMVKKVSLSHNVTIDVLDFINKNKPKANTEQNVIKQSELLQKEPQQERKATQQKKQTRSRNR